VRVAVGTLATAVEVRDREGVEPPAVTVIGEVAATRERVRAFLRNRTGDLAPGTAAVDGIDDASDPDRDAAGREGDGAGAGPGAGGDRR
jgi:uroporphyrin-III C-methyltransferase